MSLNTTLPALQVHPNSSSSVVAGSSSLASEYCSDIADETSENETPSLGRDNNSEVETEDPSLDDNLTSPIDTFVKYGMSNIDEGLTMGQIILEKLEGFPKHKLHLREVHNVIENSISNENASKSSYFTGNVLKVLSGPEHGTIVRHARKLSSESLGSDMDSQKDSELSKSTFLNSNGDGQVDFSSEAEISRTIRTLGNTDFELLNDGRLILPLDQGQKMSRVLATMQQRLVVAKTDMEDLITRLNQEISVKDYLNTKVKDLAVELETTKEKGKENLEQAILIERERLTEMQWDMEELRQRSMKMEVKLNSQQGQKLDPEVTKASVSEEKDVLQQELDAKKEELEELLKRHQELEVKSKADIKLLVKEVKSLRSSRAEVKQQLSQSLEEKSAAEDLLKQERKSNEQARTSWRELLHKCKILHDQLKECKVNLMNEIEDNLVTAISSLPDALDLSAMYDNKISLLISEVQHLAQGVDSSGSTTGRITRLDKGTLHTQLIVEELKTMLADILVDNDMLRKQVNSIILYALEMNKTIKKDDSEPPSNVTVTE
ncbi:Phox (PX) domain-containing protein [Forsythia ovata]|uniref:Phox (PX) domain-containing protein n=1 Tax=Forsythia ovata TaxID=205694 RepID=A0ABD1WG73_9LAMI